MAGVLTVEITEDGLLKMDSGGLSGVELLGCAEYVRAVVATDMVHAQRSERKRVEVPNGPTSRPELCKECDRAYLSIRPLGSCKDHAGLVEI